MGRGRGAAPTRLFGHRDHSTVLHSVTKIARLIETDPNVAETIALLKAWPTVSREEIKRDKRFTVPQLEALRLLPADGSWMRLTRTRGGCVAAQSLLRCHDGLVERERTAQRIVRYRLTSAGIVEATRLT